MSTNQSRTEELLEALVTGETSDVKPQSRVEAILKKMVDEESTEDLGPPQSRVEALLMELAENGVGGDDWWDKFQDYTNITSTADHFSGEFWTDETFKPKHDIIVKNSGTRLFNSTRITNLKRTLESRGLIIDTSACNGLTQAFQFALTKEIPFLDARSCINMSYAFSSKHIESIHIEVSEDTPFSSTFNDASRLAHLKIDGVIGQNGFNVQLSPLTYESLIGILNALKDYSEDTSGTDWVVTLGSANIAKLTQEDQDIAYNKGWRLE